MRELRQSDYYSLMKESPFSQRSTILAFGLHSEMTSFRASIAQEKYNSMPQHYNSDIDINHNAKGKDTWPPKFKVTTYKTLSYYQKMMKNFRVTSSKAEASSPDRPIRPHNRHQKTNQANFCLSNKPRHCEYQILTTDKEICAPT
jgi:hypothetical protein